MEEIDKLQPNLYCLNLSLSILDELFKNTCLSLQLNFISSDSNDQCNKETKTSREDYCNDCEDTNWFFESSEHLNENGNTKGNLDDDNDMYINENPVFIPSDYWFMRCLQHCLPYEFISYSYDYENINHNLIRDDKHTIAIPMMISGIIMTNIFNSQKNNDKSFIPDSSIILSNIKKYNENNNSNSPSLSTIKELISIKTINNSASSCYVNFNSLVFSLSSRLY